MKNMPTEAWFLGKYECSQGWRWQSTSVVAAHVQCLCWVHPDRHLDLRKVVHWTICEESAVWADPVLYGHAAAMYEHEKPPKAMKNCAQRQDSYNGNALIRVYAVCRKKEKSIKRAVGSTFQIVLGSFFIIPRTARSEVRSVTDKETIVTHLSSGTRHSQLWCPDAPKRRHGACSTSEEDDGCFEALFDTESYRDFPLAKPILLRRKFVIGKRFRQRFDVFCNRAMFDENIDPMFTPVKRASANLFMVRNFASGHPLARPVSKLI